MYEPLEVYRGLKYISASRKLQLVNSSLVGGRGRSAATASKKIHTDWLDDEKFMELIQWERYCIVEMQDDPARIRAIPTKTYFIICDRDYDINSAEINKMLTKIPHISAPSQRAFAIDVLMLTEEFLPTHAVKKMESFNASGKYKVHITNHLYTLCLFDHFARAGAITGRIVPVADEARLLAELGITRQSMPKISVSDTTCVLLGAERDNIIELQSYNENTLHSLGYRVVR